MYVKCECYLLLQCVNGILTAMVEEDMVHVLLYFNFSQSYDNYCDTFLQHVYVFSSYMHHRLQVSISFGYKSTLSRKVYATQ